MSRYRTTTALAALVAAGLAAMAFAQDGGVWRAAGPAPMAQPAPFAAPSAARSLSSESGSLAERLHEIRQGAAGDGSGAATANLDGSYVEPASGAKPLVRQFNRVRAEAAESAQEQVAAPEPMPADEPDFTPASSPQPPTGRRPLIAPVSSQPSEPAASGARTTLPSVLRTPSSSRRPASDDVEPAPSYTPAPLVDPSPSDAAVSSRPAAVESKPVASRGASVAATPEPVAARPTGSVAGKLVSAATPSIQVEAIGPSAVVVGRPSEYTIQVTNTSAAPARDVRVEIHLPAQVDVQGGEASRGTVGRGPANGAHTTVWTLDEAAPGAVQQLVLRLAATDARPIDLEIDWSVGVASAAATIEVQQPKLDIALAGPSDVNFGESKRYTLTLSNPGTGDADDVQLTLQPLSTSAAAVTKPVGSVRAGSRKTIEVELTAEEAGLLSLKASATAAGGLSADTVLEVLVRRARLQIEVTGPSLKYAGSEAMYELRVANVGDAPAEEVLAGAVLPAGAQLTAGDSGAQQGKGQVAWKVGRLAPGDARTLRFGCLFNEAGRQQIEGRIQATGAAPATAIALTQVEALADLKMTVNDPESPVAVGKDATYEVRIVNRGTKAAEKVLVRGFFSEGIEPVSIEGALGEVAVGQVVFDPLARVEPGQTVLLKIKARATAAGNHIFRAVVECPEIEIRLVAEETTRFFGAAATTAQGDSGVTTR